MKPVFAKGTRAQASLSASAAKGALTLPVNDADSIFSVGELLFCSEADGSELECLGPVTAVDGVGVTVALGLASAKSGGAKVWTPETSLLWPLGRSAPLRRTYHSGVEVQRSVGGALYHTRLADPYWEEPLVFERVARADYAQYEGWFIDTLRGGVEEFTFVDEERRVSAVKILNTAVEQEESPAGVARVAIQLARVGTSYV